MEKGKRPPGAGDHERRLQRLQEIRDELAALTDWKKTVKAIEALRFASGDEDLRAALYEEFGDDLFTNFDKVSTALEISLANWSSDEDESDEDADNEEGGNKKKGLPEKRKKKLLDPKTWERDGRLVEVATKLRAALGDSLFEDHNLFRERVDTALKDASIKLAAADLKPILKAVSWRVETAPPVIAKAHKPAKAKADSLHGPGIATYIWVLSNKKPTHRRNQIQLIDATLWFKPLRKNLGKKNCYPPLDAHIDDQRNMVTEMSPLSERSDFN